MCTVFTGRIIRSLCFVPGKLRAEEPDTKPRQLAVCDVTKLPYMDINSQSISIYGDFVTSLTAYYSWSGIKQSIGK